MEAVSAFITDRASRADRAGRQEYGGGSSSSAKRVHHSYYHTRSVKVLLLLELFFFGGQDFKETQRATTMYVVAVWTRRDLPLVHSVNVSDISC